MHPCSGPKFHADCWWMCTGANHTIIELYTTGFHFIIYESILSFHSFVIFSLSTHTSQVLTTEFFEPLSSLNDDDWHRCPIL